MVEFSLAIFVFILAVVGTIDIARAIFDEHGLTRAAESLAHTMVLDYATVQNFPGSQSALTDAASTAIQQAHAQSDTGLNSATLSLGGGSGYQLLSNSGGSGGAAVSICFSPSYAAPNVIKVTVVGAFTPVISAFVGGHTVNLSESASALTFLGQQGNGTYQNSCP
jgi:Flp pilus assembly protein TadG